MSSRVLFSLLVLHLGLGAADSLFAQQPASAASAPTEAAAPAQPSAPSTPEPVSHAAAELSPDVIKQARAAGYRAEKKAGETVFCREDTNLGTRFPTKKCVNQARIVELVRERAAAQDNMRQPGSCVGSACSGK